MSYLKTNVTRDDLHVGQEVRVFNVNARNEPDGKPGTVVKVGRSLVHISIDGGRFDPVKFRIDGQVTDFGHDWFRTLPQAEEQKRRRLAVATIRESGLLDLAGTNRVSLDKLEAIADTLAGRHSRCALCDQQAREESAP